MNQKGGCLNEDLKRRIQPKTFRVFTTGLGNWDPDTSLFQYWNSHTRDAILHLIGAEFTQIEFHHYDPFLIMGQGPRPNPEIYDDLVRELKAEDLASPRVTKSEFTVDFFRPEFVGDAKNTILFDFAHVYSYEGPPGTVTLLTDPDYKSRLALWYKGNKIGPEPTKIPIELPVVRFGFLADVYRNFTLPELLQLFTINPDGSVTTYIDILLRNKKFPNLTGSSHSDRRLVEYFGHGSYSYEPMDFFINYTSKELVAITVQGNGICERILKKFTTMNFGNSDFDFLTNEDFKMKVFMILFNSVMNNEISLAIFKKIIVVMLESNPTIQTKLKPGFTPVSFLDEGTLRGIIETVFEDYFKNSMKILLEANIRRDKLILSFNQRLHYDKKMREVGFSKQIDNHDEIWRQARELPFIIIYDGEQELSVNSPDDNIFTLPPIWKTHLDNSPNKDVLIEGLHELNKIQLREFIRAGGIDDIPLPDWDGSYAYSIGI